MSNKADIGAVSEQIVIEAQKNIAISSFRPKDEELCSVKGKPDLF